MVYLIQKYNGMGVVSMERIKRLNRYQQGILLLLLVMAPVFAVIYSVFSSRIGFLYDDKILIPSNQNGNTVYAGTIDGENCSFTVTPEKDVVFRYGENVYGPYTAREDPTAIPKDDPFGGNMTGVEVMDDGEIIFRGGVFCLGGSDSISMLINEDGTYAGYAVTATLSDGTMVDMDGNVVDPIEPSVSTILDLMHGPELTNQIDWIGFFTGLFVSVVTALSILFADEAFRWSLSFRIQNADRAEPSDWWIASRNFSWAALVIMVFILYNLGLK